MKPIPHWTFFLSKVGIALLVIGLDVAGKMTPQGNLVAITLIGALGLTHVAAVLRAAPAASPISHELIDKIGSLIVQIIASASGEPQSGTAKVRSMSIRPAAPPTSPPPVPLVPLTALAALASIVMWGALAVACWPTPGVPTVADVDRYTSEQIACSDQYGERAEINGCRGRGRAAWCARFPTAGNCTRDAGGE